MPEVITKYPQQAFLLQAFERKLRQEALSPHTVKSYTTTVRAFFDYLAGQGMPTDPRSVTREHIREYVIARLSQRKASTVAANYQCVRQFWKFLVEDLGEIKEADNPFNRLRGPRPSGSYRRVLSSDEIRKLLGTCAGRSFFDRRDLAIIRLLASTGMRAAELVGLRLQDVDLDKRVCVVHGKGDAYRLCAYDKRTARALDAYLWVRKDYPRASEPWLFLSQRRTRLRPDALNEMLNRRAREAGIAHLHPHLFRHYAIHEMLDSDMAEGHVMKLSGHKTRSMMDRYGASAAQTRAIEEYERRKIGEDL